MNGLEYALEFLDKLAHRPARPYVTIELPDEGAGPAGQPGEAAPPGYFQIRLNEMILTDERKFFKEITPATFFLADFNYAGSTVRQPFFVNNGLLSNMPAGVDAKKMRVRFRDTLVVGPTPYIGGDVGLFVGLFQTVIEDKRQALFSVFEKLFGSFDLGSLSQYVKLADKLTAEIFNCLGGEDVQCLLAERRVIGKHALPPSGYLAYLHTEKGQINKAGLIVREGTLMRNVGGKLLAVDDVDYCLVQIERLPVRNDYTTMAFQRTWERAREKMLAQQHQEAQALMLECSYQVFASADLTEEDKVRLIELYQAKLLAMKDLLGGRGNQGAATRAGGGSPVRQMQARAAASKQFDADIIAKRFDPIAALTTQLLEHEEDDAAGSLTEVQIREHMRLHTPTPRTNAEELVRALATGSMSA